MSRSEVLVVGAGLAGLSAALTLQEHGVDVEVIDAADRVGGRVATDVIDGFTLDRGFQLINSRYPELMRLGVIAELDFVFAQKAVTVSSPNGDCVIGDPRKYLFSSCNPKSGGLGEKFAFLKYLATPSKHGLSVEDELKSLGTLYLRTLKPFLTGVFLTQPSRVDAVAGKEIIKSFISGKPGLPKSGAGALPLALAARVNRITLNTRIDDLSYARGRKVIVATDVTTAAQLLDIPSIPQLAGSTTWYHEVPIGFSDSPLLHIDGFNRGPVINSIVISNMIKEYSPKGKSLLSSTTIATASESEVRRHLSEMWGTSSTSWRLIAKYEIPKSLPISQIGINLATSSKISDGVYVAGDFRSAPSQNGALLSGRLAAQELLLD